MGNLMVRCENSGNLHGQVRATIELRQVSCLAKKFKQNEKFSEFILKRWIILSSMFMFKMSYKPIYLCFLISVLVLKEVNSLQKRCMKCRSRGELGSCGDPFPFNVTDPESEIGIHVVACPSGWCGKMIEGTTGAFRTDDYGAATQRMCLQRSPSDDEERCAYTMWNYKKVYMCFCNGDLCNSAYTISSIPSIILVTIFALGYNVLWR